MPFDSLKQSLRQWQDSRRAENNARHDAKHGAPTTKTLNKRLIDALDNGWTKTATQALEQGASADTRRFYQYGASHYTYPAISHEIMRGHQDNIELLMQHAPDLNIQDSLNGHTPLMEAVIHGHTPIVRRLLDAGVQLDIRTTIHSNENIQSNEVTAQEIAEARGYDDIEEMLKAEPARRQAAAKLAKQAAAEAAQKAAQPKTPAAPADIVVKTDKSVAVSEPIRFKNRQKPKKWFQF